LLTLSSISKNTGIVRVKGLNLQHIP